MVKRIFIVHGWEAHPKDNWYPWLQKELERRKFEVYVPKMPDTDYPKIDKWVSFLAKLVKKADENTYFIGHSIGCQTILRYLETINEKIGGVIFVAGWFSLTKKAIPTKEEKETAKPWLETAVDFKQIKNNTQNFLAIFSDNDPYVPLENVKIFKEKIGAEIIIEHDMKHFQEKDGITQLPVVLESILDMLK